MNGLFTLTSRAKSVYLASLLMLVCLAPGCIESEDSTNSNADNHTLYEGNSSYVTMNIIHAESADNETLTYTIEIELYHDLAPIHTDNMRSLAQSGMYDNVTFHRIIDNFMIQGGDFENNDGTGGYAAHWYGYCDGQYMSSSADCDSETLYTLPDEADNGLRHLPCMVSMAKTSQPNTGGSQFFIMPDDISEHTWLNGAHTVFGQVISGCEHVTTLSEVETDSYDRPIIPVTIISATVSA